MGSPHIFPGLNMGSGDEGTRMVPKAVHVARSAAHFFIYLPKKYVLIPRVLHSSQHWPLPQFSLMKFIMLLTPTEIEESGTH